MVRGGDGRALPGSAAILGLTCPSAEELEDWSVHYHRRRVDIDSD